MTVEQQIRAFAGTFVLASLALGWWIHPAFFLFTAFVGVNLLQSSFSGFCPLEMMLVRRHAKRSPSLPPGERR